MGFKTQQKEHFMGYALTVKGQVTIPKAMREHMGVARGQEVDYIAQPGGKVLVFPSVKKPATGESPFASMVGIGIRKRPTDEIMRETRGEDWNR
jgi:antitoxin PrlF